MEERDLDRAVVETLRTHLERWWGSCGECVWEHGPMRRNCPGFRVLRAARSDDALWLYASAGASVLRQVEGTGHEFFVVAPTESPELVELVTIASLSDLADRVTVTSAGLIMLGAEAVFFADGGSGDDQLVGARGGGELRGGPGNDELEGSAFAPWSTRLDGGEGNDRLVGADGSEELDRGGGQDELHGGGGDDTLSDGDRSDASDELGPRADLLDGGPGRDVVSYRQRTVPVFVDLVDARSDGERGEGDKLTSIESLEGGRGDDRLAGDGARNTIDGGGGKNEPRGRGGRDEFRRAGGSTVCGKGYDVFLQPRSTDFLEPDCEAVTPNPYAGEYDLPGYPVAVTARAVAYRFHCYRDPDIGTMDRSSGTLRLRRSTRKSRRLAAATIPLGRWENLRLTGAPHATRTPPRLPPRRRSGNHANWHQRTLGAPVDD